MSNRWSSQTKTWKVKNIPGKRFWLTGKILHFRSFHGNIDPSMQHYMSLLLSLHKTRSLDFPINSSQLTIINHHHLKLIWPNTVNSLCSGQCRDLELLSSLARVRNSRSLFQSMQMSVICFRWGISCCPFYRGVLYNGVSARWELTVLTDRLLVNH